MGNQKPRMDPPLSLDFVDSNTNSLDFFILPTYPEHKVAYAETACHGHEPDRHRHRHKIQTISLDLH